MEALTVTLETAKKLKEAGFEQSTYWFWTYNIREETNIMLLPKNVGEERGGWIHVCPAPTAQELADQLPNNVDLSQLRDGSGWRAFSRGFLTNVIERNADGDTMAEALAALYIKLKLMENESE